MLFFQHHLLMRFSYHSFSGFEAEEPEQGRVDEEVEQGGADHAAEDHGGDRVQDLFAGLMGRENERNQADARRQSRHQHRGQAFQTGPHDHLLGPAFPLVSHQMQVVIQQQNPIAGGVPAREMNPTIAAIESV